MKKNSLVLATLIFGFFTFQNSHSEEPRTMYQDSSYHRFILWKVSAELDEARGRTYIKMDSVLRGKKDFYTDKKWFISNRSKICEIIDMKPNTDYIVLADALCDTPNRVCKLALRKEDCILPDTPENRNMLIKKWDDTKVIYEPPVKYPRIKGRNIDM